MNRKTRNCSGWLRLVAGALRSAARTGTLMAGALALEACTKTEKHIDIPAPIPISQWAERVDTLPGTYTIVATPAQYGDTLVLLADAGEKMVWRVNLIAGARKQIGSRGKGPGEYEHLGMLMKLGADSVALVFATARESFPVVSINTGRGRTHSIPVVLADYKLNPVLRATDPFLRAVDNHGNVYGEALEVIDVDKATGKAAIKSGHRPDTIPLVRYNIYSGRTDTLLHMPAGVLHGQRITDGNGSITSPMELRMYGAYNSWISTEDGRLVTADASNYTLQVRDTGGVITHTWQIPSNSIPVSATAWKEYVQKATKGATVELKKFTDKTFAGMGVAPPKLPEHRYIVPEMPRVLPRLNFEEGARQMHERGNVLWVPVHIVDPPSAQNWDLIDLATGTRITTVTLPNKQFLKHVTNLGAYVVAVDEDDVQRVLLYRHKQ